MKSGWARGGAFERLEARQVLAAVSIEFDYSLDTDNFFAMPETRAQLDEAAAAFEMRLQDNLAAIQPAGANTWSARFEHPATGQEITINNLTVPAGVIRIYVGSRNLPAGVLAVGGPGTSTAEGSTAWKNTVSTRGQSNVAGATATDFGPWGGVISFQLHQAYEFFGSAAYFKSVVKHEIAHVLGFGTAPSFERLVNDVDQGAVFTGEESQIVFEGAPGEFPGMSDDRSHWSTFLPHFEETPIMSPEIERTNPSLISSLDWAALDDIGWDLRPNQAPKLDVAHVLGLYRTDEDTLSPYPTTLSGLIDDLEFPISDADPDPLRGMAIVGVDNAHGTWQIKTNGQTWRNLNASISSAELVLYGDIRFVPQPNFFGESTFRYRAWDRTRFRMGDTVDTTDSGGNSPFSSEIGTARVVVRALADGKAIVTGPTSMLEDGPRERIFIARSPIDGPEIAYFYVYIGGGTLFGPDGVTAIPPQSYVSAADAAAGLWYEPTPDIFGTIVLTVRPSAVSEGYVDYWDAFNTKFTFELVGVNDRPRFVHGGNLTVGRGPQSFKNWVASRSVGPENEWQWSSFIVTPDKPDLFAVQPAIDYTGELTFTPKQGARGSTQVTVVLEDNGGTEHGGQNLSSPATLTIAINTVPQQNPANRFDVDNSGTILPLDALLIVNDLNKFGARTLPENLPAPGAYFLDPSGDGAISPADALAIVDALAASFSSSSFASQDFESHPVSATAPASGFPGDLADYAFFEPGWLPAPSESPAVFQSAGASDDGRHFMPPVQAKAFVRAADLMDAKAIRARSTSRAHAACMAAWLDPGDGDLLSLDEVFSLSTGPA